MAKTALPSARDVMTRRVHTIPEDSDITSAIRTLLQHGHSGAPVVAADGRPLGVLSEHDCIRVLAEALAESWPAGHARDHMTRDVETVRPAEDLLSLAGRFARGRHRRLLVVEDGKLVGLVTRRDLLRALDECTSARERAPSTYEAIESRHRSLD